jgi:hypothetical protein
MQAKNLLKIMPIRLYKMDKKSNRYRVCPNDGEEFMANDRTEKHCCPQCADEFHNTIKKNARIAKKQKQEESEKALNEISQQLDNEEKNLQILDQLDVKENGSQFNMDFLHSLGFDFFTNISKEALYNIDPQLNCYYVQIGAYRLFRVEITEVLIKKIK